MSKQKKILFFVSFAVCMLFGGELLASPGNGGKPPYPVPLDGGVSALIAAGVAYGVKKYRDYRMNKKEEDSKTSE